MNNLCEKKKESPILSALQEKVLSSLLYVYKLYFHLSISVSDFDFDTFPIFSCDHFLSDLFQMSQQPSEEEYDAAMPSRSADLTTVLQFMRNMGGFYEGSFRPRTFYPHGKEAKKALDGQWLDCKCDRNCDSKTEVEVWHIPSSNLDMWSWHLYYVPRESRWQLVASDPMVQFVQDLWTTLGDITIAGKLAHALRAIDKNFPTKAFIAALRDHEPKSEPKAERGEQPAAAE